MDKTYFNKIVENLEEVNEKQAENIKKAACLMADAIEKDKLINVYGGGGHTTWAKCFSERADSRI